MSIEPTPHKHLNYILNIYKDHLQSVLGDDLIALYLTGSFALNSGDQHSDVDFFAIVEKDFDSDRVAQIEAMHQAIYDIYPQWSSHLEGSYFPRAILPEYYPNFSPIWYIDNGAKQLERSTHDNNSPTRWVTHHHGIALYGEPAQQMIPPVSDQLLISDVKQIMRQWGQDIINRRWDINNLWAQPFAVISYCRMLQTIATATVQSKPAAVAWALQNLDARWHSLIEDAWQQRPYPGEQVYRHPQEANIAETIHFIKFAIEHIMQ